MIFAYLDIGSGSLLVQMILGGFAGLGVFIKMRWHRVRSFFSRSSRSAQTKSQ